MERESGVPSDILKSVSQVTNGPLYIDCVVYESLWRLCLREATFLCSSKDDLSHYANYLLQLWFKLYNLRAIPMACHTWNTVCMTYWHVHESLGMVTVWCPVDLWCTNTIDYIASSVSYYILIKLVYVFNSLLKLSPLTLSPVHCYMQLFQKHCWITVYHWRATPVQGETCLIYSREVKYQVNSLSRGIVWVWFVLQSKVINT